jgi:FkbM family methyltransferase
MIPRFFRSSLHALSTLAEFPDLLRTLYDGTDREFVKDLLFLRDACGVHPHAVLDIGAKEEETVFHRNKFSYSSSLLPMTGHHRTVYPQSARESTIPMRCRRLENVSLPDLESPIFMKIDVQGAELLVLQGREESSRSARPCSLT